MSLIQAVKLPRVAFCTEGRYKIFNPAATGLPDLETFRRVAGDFAGLGYSGVEVVATTLADDPLKISAHQAEAFADAARAEGVEIVGLHWALAKIPGVYLTHPDTAVRSHTVDIIVRLINLTGDLNGKLIVHGSPAQRNLMPTVFDSMAFHFAKTVYQNVMDRVRDRNVLVCFEQLSRLETDFVTTQASLQELVRAVARPNFVGHIDFKALYPSCQNPEEAARIVEAYAPLSGHCHLNDWTSMSGPGCGQLEMKPFYRALGKAGYFNTAFSPKGSNIGLYPRWLSVEPFDFTLRKDCTVEQLMDIARRSFENIKENQSLWDVK